MNFLIHNVVGNGAVVLCDIGNGAMNALQYWQLHDDACEYTTFLLSLRRPMNFMAAWQLGS